AGYSRRATAPDGNAGAHRLDWSRRRQPQCGSFRRIAEPERGSTVATAAGWRDLIAANDISGNTPTRGLLMNRTLAIATAIVIAAGAVWWWQQQRATPALTPAARVQLPLQVPVPQSVQRDEPAPTTAAAPVREIPAIPVPGMLDGSDEMTRAAANELSPTLLKW